MKDPLRDPRDPAWQLIGVIITGTALIISILSLSGSAKLLAIIVAFLGLIICTCIIFLSRSKPMKPPINNQPPTVKAASQGSPLETVERQSAHSGSIPAEPSGSDSVQQVLQPVEVETSSQKPPIINQPPTVKAASQKPPYITATGKIVLPKSETIVYHIVTWLTMTGIVGGIIVGLITNNNVFLIIPNIPCIVIYFGYLIYINVRYDINKIR